MKKKLLQFEGFKYSHLTNQEYEFNKELINTRSEAAREAAANTNCHFLIFGSSGSGKTSFLKYFLGRSKRLFLVFGRDSTEIHEQNFIPLLQLETNRY